MILWFIQSAAAQSTDSLLFEDRIYEILLAKQEGEFQQAFFLSEELIADPTKNRNQGAMKGKALFTKGRVEIDLGSFDAAIASAFASTRFFDKKINTKELADSYNLIGVGYYFNNQLDSTIQYYRKSIELKSKLPNAPESIAISAYNLGKIYEDTGRFDEAIEAYLTAEKELKKVEDEQFIADVYLGLSNTYRHKNDYHKARTFGELALGKAIVRYGVESPEVTFFYISTAHILSVLGDEKKALELLDKSVQLRERYYGVQHHWTEEAYLQYGKEAMKQGKYVLSQEILKKAIETDDETKGLYNSKAKLELAKLYLIKNSTFDKTKELAEVYIQEMEAIYGTKNPISMEGYLLLAQATDDELEFRTRLNEARICGNCTAKELNEIKRPFQCLESYELETIRLSKETQLDKKNTHLLAQFKLIDKKIQLIKHIYDGYTADESKIQLGNHCKNIIEQDIEVCYHLYEMTKDKDYIKKALELSEMNRNAALLDGIQENRYKFLSGIQTKDLKTQQRFVQKRAALNLAIQNIGAQASTDIVALSKLYEERKAITHQMDSFRSRLELKYPRLKRLRSFAEVFRVADCQKLISKDQQILSYFIGDRYGYVFNTTREDLWFIVISRTSR